MRSHYFSLGNIGKGQCSHQIRVILYIIRFSQPSNTPPTKSTQSNLKRVLSRNEEYGEFILTCTTLRVYWSSHVTVWYVFGSKEEINGPQLATPWHRTDKANNLQLHGTELIKQYIGPHNNVLSTVMKSVIIDVVTVVTGLQIGNADSLKNNASSGGPRKQSHPHYHFLALCGYCTIRKCRNHHSLSRFFRQNVLIMLLSLVSAWNPGITQQNNKLQANLYESDRPLQKKISIYI